MELIFLGTGNAFYTEGMDMSSLLIRHGSDDILVDCGPGCLKNYLKFAENCARLKYIFITHFHGDHIAGLPSLLLYLKMKNKSGSLPGLIGPKGIKRRVKKLCELCYKGSGLTKGIGFRELKKRNYEIKEFANGVCEYRCYPMTHKKESLGYRLTFNSVSVAITGDTGWNNNIVSMAEGCELLITECSNLVPEITMHLSLEELIKQIDFIHAKSIILVHRGEGVKEALEKEPYPGIRIAQDGDKIRLDQN